MASLEYSNEALEAKGLFYNKKITVYVEGQDDPLFWSPLFKVAEIEAYVEDVGGSNELEKYINKIKEENAEFYVATDNDHSDFIENKFVHPNIIRTYGYSIENSMYFNLLEIEKIICRLSRKNVDTINLLNEWMHQFSSDVYPLIIYDIANHRFKKGVRVFGDSCQQFLKGKKSYEICPVKTQAYIEKIKPNFLDEEIVEVESLVNKNKKDYWFMIKGHFITNAIINFIKSNIIQNGTTSIVFTPDFLYSVTVDCSERWSERIDINSIISDLLILKKTLNN